MESNIINTNRKLYKPQEYSNFRELIVESSKKYGGKSAFQIKIKDNVYHFISYDELKDRYYNLCNAFLDKNLLGERIAVIGKNSFEWVISYLAAATVGVAVPIDKELGSEDIESFVAAAKCKAVCCDESILKKQNHTNNKDVKFWTFSEIGKMSGVYCEDSSLVDSIHIRDDAMQVLIFTSGTTGSSKGVCLSQKNICTNIYSTSKIVEINSDDKTLSLLPLHHTYECTLNCLLLLSKGACITYCGGLMKISQDLVEYQPSILVVVPALLILLEKQIRKSISRECQKRYKKLYEEYSLGVALKKTPFFIRRAICKRVRKSLGNRLRRIIVGAADLKPSLVEDFLALGIRTLQGYGLTECAPLVAGNSDFDLNPNSTGKVIPGVEIKIIDKNEQGIGEITVKGDNVMLGYYDDGESTNKVLVDGYFHTGDLGCFDKTGFLYIKGRIKNVIVTNNGKNVYPEELENRLSQISIISEALVLAFDEGGKIHVKAKIFPNLDVLKDKLGGLPSLEDINVAINSAIKEVNSRTPAYKHIRIVEVLSEKLERTTTQKIKRFGSNLT